MKCYNSNKKLKSKIEKRFKEIKMPLTLMRIDDIITEVMLT